MLILCSLVHTEHEFWGLFTIGVAAALYKVMAGNEPFINLWYTVIGHPLQVGLVILAYLLLGVAWSFFKYYTYVKGEKKKGVSKTSLASENNTGRAIGWMAYWPISILAYVIGDGVYKMFVWIYDTVRGVYTNILNSVYGD